MRKLNLFPLFHTYQASTEYVSQYIFAQIIFGAGHSLLGSLHSVSAMLKCGE